MDFRKIEKKWQKRWEDTRLYAFDPSRRDEKFYVLEMFSYPSGAKLHVGHWYNYGLSDSYARFKRMQGYNVFHPMGFDAFGLPAENYAIKTGIHPQDSTLTNIDTMKRQLREMGATFDWDYEVVTCMPEYYKWTQWLFLRLFERGLAYRKQAPVNYCPGCNTVLANEQVIDAACERCGTAIEKKNLTQWFFRITDYAEELLGDLDRLDWPEKTKTMQRNWIGKSVGGEIVFRIEGTDLSFPVFTTRADTLFGCTYVVLAPEHELVDAVTTAENREAVENYRAECAKATEIERQSALREKTGVFTGSYAINPVNGRKVPVWIADYVLVTYGTGAVMAVPGHDIRDFEFSTRYGLPIERVIKGFEGVDDALPFVEYGTMVNSPGFDGLKSEEGMAAVIEKLMEKGDGAFKTNYRLRDWLISRQRYWGTPIPIIHCEACGTVPVPYDQLPVLLPYDADFCPKGTSPLASNEEFVNVPCPRCGGPARRDPDTMDTFVCSSWYFLRYADNKNDARPFDTATVNRMLPVDKYIGGAEHACMHLLYARFFVKALRDMGFLSFDEPFASLVHQGVILGPDGNRMSKSHGNVISPDDYIDKYGSDVFRMYLGFGFAYIEGGAWNDDGIKAVHRFLERVERLVARIGKTPPNKGGGADGASEKELQYVRHHTIKSVTADIDRFQFNTAIARLMELVNALYKYIDAGGPADAALLRETAIDLLRLLAPFAPHAAEELWERSGGRYSVHNQRWPRYDEAMLRRDTVEIGIQVNSRMRAHMDVDAGLSDEEVGALALKEEKVMRALDGKEVKKVIVVKGRLVNIVAG
ncbi:MAG: leucine--tRNA ligase [Christensenellales bacterium]|jgi:leucyl-tRNA synthetase